jgi:hypothetical protein
MMALMPRKTIYLFDVCLLATLFDRAAFALRLAKSGEGTPKNHRLLARNGGSQICNENPAELSFAVP